jgi:hypothetical protein
MFLCFGPSRRRILLQCTQLYSVTELFNEVKQQARDMTIWLEHGPSYKRVHDDVELYFACGLISQEIDSFVLDEDREEHKRCVADTAHTAAYEQMLARGYRKRTCKLTAYNSRNSTDSVNMVQDGAEHEPASIELSDTVLV